MNKKITITIADDHSIIYAGIKTIVSIDSNFDIIAYANTVNLLEEELKKKEPNILILDIDMPGLNGFDFIRRNKTKYPDMKIILLTMHEGEGYFREALSFNINGYILKSENLNELPGILTKIMNGELYYSNSMLKYLSLNDSKSNFTDTEIKIITMLNEGLKYQEIAERLELSRRTIVYHITKLKERFNTESNVELINYFKKIYYK